MKPLRFVKLSGAGNDFILVERRAQSLSSWPSLARRLCPRRTSVGADGLLVVSREKKRRLGLEYFNADGSRAFCGNGSRCAAWWMHSAGWAGREFDMETIEGPLRCRIVGRERVRIHMPDAAGWREVSAKALGRQWEAAAVHTGVPHAVVPVRGLDGFPVFETGRALRRAEAFGREGANVNFIERGRGAVRVRTYERGVEDETLACGTGAAASALSAHRWWGLKPPVAVRTRGGLLRVGFSPSGPSGFARIWLEGPARIIYTGEARL